MEKYRWEHPYEWLVDKVNSGEWDKNLRVEILELASHLDGDTLQDIYQSDMDADNYFKPLK